MKVWVFAAVACLLPTSGSAQNWVKQDRTDAFTGKNYVQYSLTGKFLTPPQHGENDAPRIVLQCVPGERKYAGKWYAAGGFIKAWIDVGAVLNNTPNGVAVLYRRDDGKLSLPSGRTPPMGKGSSLRISS
jgi:hypothetical protein